jgi:hypothetical protein
MLESAGDQPVVSLSLRFERRSDRAIVGPAAPSNGVTHAGKKRGGGTFKAAARLPK